MGGIPGSAVSIPEQYISYRVWRANRVPDTLIIILNRVPETLILNRVPETLILNRVPETLILNRVPETLILNRVPETLY